MFFFCFFLMHAGNVSSACSDLRYDRQKYNVAPQQDRRPYLFLFFFYIRMTENACLYLKPHNWTESGVYSSSAARRNNKHQLISLLSILHVSTEHKAET